MFERKVFFFLWVLPILFDTARERASKSAMEGLVPAKKLGLLSTREVRAFVTCGGWLQIWGLRKFSILEKHLMFAYSWTQRIESRIDSIHSRVVLIKGGKARQQPGNEEDYIEPFLQGDFTIPVKISNNKTKNKPGQISEYIGLPVYSSPSTHRKFQRVCVRVDQRQLELCRFPKRRFKQEVENILQLTYQLMSRLGKVSWQPHSSWFLVAVAWRTFIDWILYSYRTLMFTSHVYL